MARKYAPFALGVLAGLVLAAAWTMLSKTELARPSRAAEAEPQPPPAALPSDTVADERAIRQTATHFMKAFNAGDAQAVAALWATDARYTNEDGLSYYGREDIEKLYAEDFADHPGAMMTIKIESIRFLGPDIAVEKGVAEVRLAQDEVPTAAHYTVVHAKRDGNWVMVVGRDSPFVPGDDTDRLKEFAWLIGEWKVEKSDQPMRAKFEWMEQKNFIRNLITTSREGEATLAGGQIIGWNPLLGKIVSWHFEMQGGFGNSVWTKDGNRWVCQATGVLHNGSESSAVNIITPIDANSFTWQSANRTLDGVELPDIPPVRLVRVAAGQASGIASRPAGE